MKRKKNFLINPLLLALLILCLAFCQGCEKDEDTKISADPIETLSPAEALDLSGFSVVRSDSSEKVVTDAAISLKNSINEKVTNANIALETDWINRGETPPADTSEIIVGDTNRRAAEGLRHYDYSISRSGNRIYILGGSDEAVASAVNFFIGNYLSEAGAVIPDGTDYISRGTYRAGKLSFGNTEINELVVYKGDTDDDRCSAYIDRIIPVIEDATGLSAIVTGDRDAANIIFDSSYDVPKGSWGFSASDGKLTLTGRTFVECRRLYEYVKSVFDSADGSLEFSGVYSKEQQTKEEYLAENHLVVYPEFPEQIKRDYRYEVSVTQGDVTEKLPVYNHVMESTISRAYDGADDARRFSMFAFSGETVRVDIKVNEDFDSYTVMPSAKKFNTSFKDGVISVWIDKPEYFMIRLDDHDNSIISVFADQPEFPDEIDPDDPDTTVIEGWYEPEDGIFKVSKANQTVYIAPGAVLNARVDVRGEGSKIIGHGAILDPFENIYEHDISAISSDSGRYLLNVTGNGITLDGPVLLDARTYNITLNGDNHVVRNMKALSTMITSDGISVFYGKNDLIENCFVYNGDNSIVLQGEGTVVRDVICGTTCAAIFPQGSLSDNLLENIHVFRADDGVINNLHNGNSGQLTADVTIRNLDSVDCTYVPWFFFGRNMGKAEKNYRLENISLGDADSQKMTTVFRFANSSSTLESDNYVMSMKNFAINGKLIGSVDDITVKLEGDPKYPGNRYSCESDDFKPAVRSMKEVGYTAPDKVFVGTWQIFFENPVISENGGLLIPADELMYELRTEKCAGTTDKNGVKYVKASDIVSSGMASAVEEKDGALYITLNAPTGNLLLPDEGELSRFSEATPYQLHLVTSEENGETIYTVKNHAMTTNSGIDRIITEEARKYGEGKYVLTFMAKAQTAGKLSVGIYLKNGSAASESFEVGTDWKEVTLEVNLTAARIADEKLNICIKGSGEPIESFSVKDISLVKAS